MNIRTYKTIIIIGYTLILGVIAIDTIQHFNFRELFRFILFWILFTTWVCAALGNAENVKKKGKK